MTFRSMTKYWYIILHKIIQYGLRYPRLKLYIYIHIYTRIYNLNGHRDRRHSKTVFLNRRALTSIIPAARICHFSFLSIFFMNKYFIVEKILRRIIFVNVSKNPDPECLNNICVASVSDLAAYFLNMELFMIDREISDTEIFQYSGKGIPLFMTGHKNCLQADYNNGRSIFCSRN